MPLKMFCIKTKIHKISRVEFFSRPGDFIILKVSSDINTRQKKLKLAACTKNNKSQIFTKFHTT